MGKVTAAIEDAKAAGYFVRGAGLTGVLAILCVMLLTIVIVQAIFGYTWADRWTKADHDKYVVEHNLEISERIIAERDRMRVEVRDSLNELTESIKLLHKDVEELSRKQSAIGANQQQILSRLNRITNGGSSKAN